MEYSVDQWILFFFFYCFCGWIWESCFVSVRQHRWVNRGFLHGPLLPIYGFGAIIILLATLWVQSQPVLVYLLGMAAATVLEYFTGAAMEKLFHVRYWDYSDQKFNLNGHICLACSLGWGVFSVLLVYGIHPPVARLITAVPYALAQILVPVLICGFTVDAVQSFRAACDLRQMLEQLTNENEDLRRFAQRAEVISAFAEDDLRQFQERTHLRLTELEDRQKVALTQRLNGYREKTLQAQQAVCDALETCRARLEERVELTEAARIQRKAEIDEALDRLRDHAAHIRTRDDEKYRSALRILRGNPTASAQKYKEALDTLRKLGK